MTLQGNCVCGIAERGRTGSFYPNGMTAWGGKGIRYGLGAVQSNLLLIPDEHSDLLIHTGGSRNTDAEESSM